MSETEKGSYILIIYLPLSYTFPVGKLGMTYFDKGWYAYVGSAMKGFETRISHHCKVCSAPQGILPCGRVTQR